MNSFRREVCNALEMRRGPFNKKYPTHLLSFSLDSSYISDRAKSERIEAKSSKQNLKVRR